MRPDVRCHIEIRFIERERLDQRREAMQDCRESAADFPPINIEARWQHDQIRTALQRHESRHGRADAKLSRFVIAGRQHAATIACAAHADRFSAQLRLIAHFNRGVEAIHVEMDDAARLGRLVHFTRQRRTWFRASAHDPGRAEARL